MKIKQIDFLIRKGEFSRSSEFDMVLEEVKFAVKAVVWPEGSTKFTIFPKKMANGVVPIKKECMNVLVQQDWTLEYRMSIASRVKPGPIDAVKRLSNDQFLLLSGKPEIFHPAIAH